MKLYNSFSEILRKICIKLPHFILNGVLNACLIVAGSLYNIKGIYLWFQDDGGVAMKLYIILGMLAMRTFIISIYNKVNNYIANLKQNK